MGGYNAEQTKPKILTTFHPLTLQSMCAAFPFQQKHDLELVQAAAFPNEDDALGGNEAGTPHQKSGFIGKL